LRSGRREQAQVLSSQVGFGHISQTTC
jgi:hypothetical protein